LRGLTPEQQAETFKNCFRKDWQDKESHLLPAKHLAVWIDANLYLALAEAPFPTDYPALNEEARLASPAHAVPASTHNFLRMWRPTTA
jgi:hypothetical protein